MPCDTTLGYWNGDVGTWEDHLVDKADELRGVGSSEWRANVSPEGRHRIVELHHEQAAAVDVAIEDARLSHRLAVAQAQFEAARDYAASLVRANDLPYPGLAPIGVGGELTGMTVEDWLGERTVADDVVVVERFLERFPSGTSRTGKGGTNDG